MRPTINFFAMFIRIMCSDYFFENISINKFENLANPKGNLSCFTMSFPLVITRTLELTLNIPEKPIYKFYDRLI